MFAPRLVHIGMTMCAIAVALSCSVQATLIIGNLCSVFSVRLGKLQFAYSSMCILQVGHSPLLELYMYVDGTSSFGARLACLAAIENV